MDAHLCEQLAKSDPDADVLRTLNVTIQRARCSWVRLTCVKQDMNEIEGGLS